MTATGTGAGSARSGRLDAGIARHPDTTEFAVSADGVRLAYDIYGQGPTTIVLLPSSPIIHARQWKAQIHFLSRHYRVVAYDGRGNGRSDRPTDAASYHDDRQAGDIAAVLDATGTSAAVLVGQCGDGVWRSIRLAATAPERVQGIIAFAVGVPRLSPPQPHYVQWSFDDELPTDEGWAKYNRHFWKRDYPAFAQFFFGEMTSEPHSSKAIEDAVSWAVDGSVDVMLAEADAGFALDREAVEGVCRSVTCPMLLVHGSEDSCQPLARAERLAELTGAPLVVVEGADHMIPGRHPVLANLLIRDFMRSIDEGGPV